MTLFSRYMFRQVTSAFLLILLTLTAIIWLATALKELDLITSQGQGLTLFFHMTALSLPSLIALIAPNAVLMACLYTLDRMNGDSEIIVMTAAGATVWRICRPLIALGVIVSMVILLINVLVNPACMRALRDLITQVRADLISQVLQPGRFSSPERGLTFHIRDRSKDGELLGLLFHDERDSKQVMSYLAERGRILSNEKGSFLIMFDGYVHRYDAKDKEKSVQIIKFDQNMVDLSKFGPQNKAGNKLEPKQMPLMDLINPPVDEKLDEKDYGQLRHELHERLATPLYPIAFIFIAIALMGEARTTRESRWGQILTVFAIAVAIRVAGIMAGNLVALNAWAVALVYAIPVAAILIAAWTAHVRMSPELRSKLNFELKFQPKNIRLWAARGVQTG
ncbi:LPS export ABC transporter permease LptF [Methyloceanibacter sp.]|uniref:LPS export ABC transporter permease LptF n=1 Tax=Methyloceanibacter sp. TaxID=1965321 RepID=UPI002C5A02FC|nr:LPS export ABC transporter permease LptF [Methyloceanibacter sp.]HML92167.1 LPS export ABC transporter permease LptF [Methyloceanibacter sp.]